MNDATAVAVPETSEQDALDAKYAEIFGGRFRGAVLEITRTFRTPLTVMIFRREFTYLSRLMYMFQVYSRIKDFDQDKVDKSEAHVLEKLDALGKLVQLKHTALSEILKDNNVRGTTTFIKVSQTVTLPIISPHASQLVEIMEAIDAYHCDLMAAYYSRVVDKQGVNKDILQIRKGFRSFSGTVRLERVALMKALLALSKKATPDTQEVIAAEISEEETMAAAHDSADAAAEAAAASDVGI